MPTDLTPPTSEQSHSTATSARAALQSLSIALAPLAIVVTALYESAYFTALGLADAHRLPLVFPIPFLEILRPALVTAIVILTGSAIGFATYYSARVLLKAAFALLYVGIREIRTTIYQYPGSHAFFAAERTPAKPLPINATSRFLVRARRLARRSRGVVVLIGCFSGYQYFLAPAIELSFDYFFPTPQIGKFILTATATALSLALLFYILIAGLGEKIPKSLHIDFDRWHMIPLILLVVFGLVYSAGFEAGIGQRALDAALGRENKVQLSGKSCAPFVEPNVVRSYSTGSIVLDKNQLVWVNSSGDLCWSVRLQQAKYSMHQIVPTFFGYELAFMSFEVRRRIR